MGWLFAIIPLWTWQGHGQGWLPIAILFPGFESRFDPSLTSGFISQSFCVRWHFWNESFLATRFPTLCCHPLRQRRRLEKGWGRRKGPFLPSDWIGLNFQRAHLFVKTHFICSHMILALGSSLLSHGPCLFILGHFPGHQYQAEKRGKSYILVPFPGSSTLL